MLSKLLKKYLEEGNEELIQVVKDVSRVTWLHINLHGLYRFRNVKADIDWEAIVKNVKLFKELQWNWSAQLKAQLQFLHHTERVRFKGLALNDFDVTFTANADLPVSIGIGKGVPQGYGDLTLNSRTAARSSQRK